MKYSNDDLLKLLRDLAAKTGRSPTKRDFDAHYDGPSEMIYRCRFGSWSTAVRAAGFEPIGPHPSLQCRLAVSRAKKGKPGTHFKGGRHVDNCGYVNRWMPEHPNANKNGYVREHRYLMAEKIGRPLRADEDVHHINGVKSDNRIENLELMLKSEHTRHHATGRLKPKKNYGQCVECDHSASGAHGRCLRHYKAAWHQARRAKIIGNIHQNPDLVW